MKKIIFEGILDKLLSLSIAYRHMKAFFQYFPQQGTGFGVYATKISLLRAFSHQQVVESKPNGIFCSILPSRIFHS